MGYRERYNARWRDDLSDLQIELAIIRKGGSYQNGERGIAGRGLPYHYEAVRKLLWPWLDDHRWNRLCRDEILKNKITVLMGPKSSGKTHTAAWVGLVSYYASPNDTCVLVSSTDLRGLELRVWGEIKMLHESALENYGEELPGFLIDSKHCIATDDVKDKEIARDLRKGIIGIPCVQNGKYVGLGKYAGIKQKNVFLIADEAQFMGTGFLSAFANLDGNENFKAAVLGNPNDPLDPLGRAAEPKDGWDSHLQPEKTDVWDTKFMDGRCVNLVGTDSPNFDFPESEPTRFKYLISREKIASVVSFFGKDSLEYYSQCIGVMKVGQLSRRVITPTLCKKYGALDDVVWKGTSLIRIGCLDASYGGDRCVIRHLDFGSDIDGKQVLSFSPCVIIPVRIAGDKLPEEQIAEFCRDYCLRHGILPENFFYDSTGRGTLGTSFARAWSANVNPVEFGGRPTERPVSLDLMITDPKTGIRRLKLCSEHYVKFVTELWFAVRYAIEASQIRNLGQDVVEEGSMREYDRVNENKIEIETKADMKERVGRSPDLFDCTVIGVEGARRRGFVISKLTNEQYDEPKNSWFWELQKKNLKARERFALNHSA